MGGFLVAWLCEIFERFEGGDEEREPAVSRVTLPLHRVSIDYIYSFILDGTIVEFH